MSNNKTQIKKATKALLNELPDDVKLLAIADGCSQAEVEAALDAGVTHVGHSSIRNVEPMIHASDRSAIWHMTGHLKRRQVKKTVQLFEMVDRLDSWNLAKMLDRRGRKKGKIMSVLIEIRNNHKDHGTSILLETLEKLILRMGVLQFVRVEGLMTMGSRKDDPEKSRSLFRAMREAYDSLSDMNSTHTTMRYLSMGSSNDYHVAIEEGANLIRIGTKIFGKRQQRVP
jgi:pyridoxal phosphate enzyme (YggS family)